ncbi:hypothetical protein Aasi_0873 [Candidatus Amoebophilus asiaticus 5a2]|uniref:Toprim domain-containing protein n=1 Tax=Amoebophilus asiaticus (strain 5a2) TaxID=452471 RepID=B3ESP0_AMOA5|nr:toprim domain-containing protein [Candidatus Amoebophilus asiaticus]ACE06242.1 hypothetical protein Aasi_0873 [Candidatus Amoebophilus asiaticus 5a2]
MSKFFTLKEANTLIVTDTPIDALSYRQLSAREDSSWKHVRKATQQAKELDKDQGKTAYLSTCGYLSPSMYEDFKQVAKLAKEDKKTVVVAFNADTDGQSMARSLAYVLKNEDVAYRVEVPLQGKSWNEVLTQKRDLHRLEDSKSIAAKTWAAFEEKPYEASLLHQIGIEKDTHEAFRNVIKTNEKEILVALQRDSSKENVVSTWNLNWDKEKGYKEYIDPGPVISILKGNIRQAERVVLTTSPLDALLHYQKELQAIPVGQKLIEDISQKPSDLSVHQPEEQGLQQAEKSAFTTSSLDNLLSYKYQKEVQAAASKETVNKLSTMPGQHMDERLDKIDNTCYIYVKAKEKRHLLEEPLNRVLQEVQSEKKELIIAASKGMNRLTEVLEYVLEKQQYQYSKDMVEMPAVSQDLAASLGSGISLFAALASTNRSMDGEDYDEDDDKKKRHSLKRGM